MALAVTNALNRTETHAGATSLQGPTAAVAEPESKASARELRALREVTAPGATGLPQGRP